MSNLERKLKAYHSVHGKFPDSLEEMAADGFAATDKMVLATSISHTSGASTSKGNYKVFINTHTATGPHSLTFHYWDYTHGSWMERTIDYREPDGWVIGDPYGGHLFSPGSDSSGCTTQLLEDCVGGIPL